LRREAFSPSAISDLLAVDNPAALDRPGLGAERNTAGRRRATLRERLRIYRAVLDDTFIVHGAPTFMFGPCLGIHVEIVGERTGP
jgi:hypothetical protein